jgi:hypothetical protein
MHLLVAERVEHKDIITGKIKENCGALKYAKE